MQVGISGACVYCAWRNFRRNNKGFLFVCLQVYVGESRVCRGEIRGGSGFFEGLVWNVRSGKVNV